MFFELRMGFWIKIQVGRYCVLTLAASIGQSPVSLFTSVTDVSFRGGFTQTFSTDTAL